MTIMGLYIQGGWGHAKDLMAIWLTYAPEDKCAHVIDSYMKKFNYKAPEDWEGTRVLTDK